MARTPGDDVRRVRRWLRLSGGVSLLAGLGCLVMLVTTWRINSPARLLVLVVGIGLVVYGVAALTTVVGPGSVER
jgi:uncharacterized membrane protein HdeD (DUF308 family)